MQGGGWDSKLIQYTTRCNYSHVEALDPLDEHVTYGAMLRGGVKRRFYTDTEYHNAKNFKTVRIICTAEQEEKFYNFIASQLGKPYDWRAVVSFGLGQRDWREDGSWFCSEAIIRGLEEAGLLYVPDDFPAWRLNPSHAYMLAGVQTSIVLEKAA